MKIDLFVPPEFSYQPLNIEKLNKKTSKQWNYASSGRASLYHILKPLNIDKILIPVYICSTILEPLTRLNIKPIFYDLDIEDLNASLQSIEYLSNKNNVTTLLVASMYGNPANLIEIEKFCVQKNIFLIDDAAQSFNAKLKDRYIGAFGNAGFFSFSPGKPLAGHMGSFFWSDRPYEINRTKNCFAHYIKWMFFYITRYKTYKSSVFFKKVITLFYVLITRFISSYDDDICRFEKPILGGILSDKFEFRRKNHDKFVENFSSNDYFLIIKNIRGEANNHKIVLYFKSVQLAQTFVRYMSNNEIHVLKGYSLLSHELDGLTNAETINGKIVELPIEECMDKMNYMFCKVSEFDGG